MNEIIKTDVSISMEKANLYGLFVALPAVIAELGLFLLVNGTQAYKPSMGYIPLVILVIIGIVVHEMIHGLAWAFFGEKPLRAIHFGFAWKTLSPFAHCNEPMKVDAYRLGTLAPGLLLGIVPFLGAVSLVDGNMLWFGLVHTAAACGDWLVLWIIRKVPSGSLVEDHPSRAGCYVLEPPAAVQSAG